MKQWVELPKEMMRLVTAWVGRIRPKRAGPSTKSQAPVALRIGSYKLTLLDQDGQVFWTNEWDTGGVFDLCPHHRMWVFCKFTNHSKREAEIAEYEIELVGEDGVVVERFGSSFGDSVIIKPGQSQVFPGQWRL